MRCERLRDRITLLLDGELPALELIFALHRIGAGARHRRSDVDRIAGRARRKGSHRRVIRCPGVGCETQRHPQPRNERGRLLEHRAARK